MNPKILSLVNHSNRTKVSLRQCFRKQKHIFNSLHFSNLSFKSKPIHVGPSKMERITSDSLARYILEVLEKIYDQDSIGIKSTIQAFLKAKLQDLKPKLQQRLSLQKYLSESLKYRPMSQIAGQIRKQWKKNLLLQSLNRVWGRCMLTHSFSSIQEISEAYHRQRNLIANVSHYYFQQALEILKAQGSQTFSHLYENATHHIINDLKEWKQIYHRKIAKLVQAQSIVNQDESLDFDLSSLEINPHYIDVDDETNQLSKTTELIQLFTQEYRIHQQISLLRDIRSAFLKEMEQNSSLLCKKRSNLSIRQLQKDDVIGCMIYCIVKGEIVSLETTLQTMNLLIGKDSRLLSQKKVDISMADLQGAVQFIGELANNLKATSGTIESRTLVEA